MGGQGWDFGGAECYISGCMGHVFRHHRKTNLLGMQHLNKAHVNADVKATANVTSTQNCNWVTHQIIRTCKKTSI